MQPVAVDFELEPLGERAGFRLVGELDLVSAPELGGALAEVGSENGIVLDVRELTFLDSSGCNVLTTYLRGGDGGRRIVLVAPTPAVERTLELTGLRRHPQIEIRARGG